VQQCAYGRREYAEKWWLQRFKQKNEFDGLWLAYQFQCIKLCRHSFQVPNRTHKKMFDVFIYFIFLSDNGNKSWLTTTVLTCLVVCAGTTFRFVWPTLMQKSHTLSS
jgi:hypothetical protein